MLKYYIAWSFVIYIGIISTIMFAALIVFNTRKMLIWINKSKIQKIINSHLYEIFDSGKSVIDFNDYFYQPNNNCYYDCSSCCSINNSIRKKQVVLQFPSLNDYLEKNIRYFHFKFLNREIRSQLRECVLKRMHLDESCCVPENAIILASPS